nr:hypothetical protein CFP56_30482 [Quercus suber]
MVFIVLIFCYALGLEFEEFDVQLPIPTKPRTPLSLSPQFRLQNPNSDPQSEPIPHVFPLNLSGFGG